MSGGRRAAKWVFWLLAPVPVVLVGLLMAGHVLTLPKPDERTLAHAPRGHGFRALHVMALTCACSRGLIRHLVERGAQASWQETVALIGRDDALETELRQA
ncbi:MAG: hypothetical protein JNG84_14250, partial [Archangium sp.]|nr:hypothetical protein [Archangium sp.]